LPTVEINFAAFRKIKVDALDGMEAEEAKLLEENPLLELRGERHEEMRRSGTMYHDNGESGAGSRSQ
jgi:hypothetical protein